MIAGVVELEIRSFEEADRRSGDEHLPGLRQGSDAADCMEGDAADVAGLALDLARVHAGADLQSIVLGAVANRGGTADGARRAIEEGQETVSRGRDFQAAEAVELAPHAIAVACEDLLPDSVAQPDRYICRAHDVSHEQRGDDALAGFRRFSPAAYAGELDRTCSDQLQPGWCTWRAT